MAEKIQKEEEKEVQREEVPLDETPDSSTVESDEKNDASANEEDLIGDNPSGVEPEGPPRRGVGRFLRNKWLLLSFAGVFSILLGFMLGYESLWDATRGGQGSEVIRGESGKQEDGVVDTGLQPFFVPLPAGSENVAIKLEIKVLWKSGAFEKYKERSAFVRNSMLTYFLGVARSKEGFGVDRSRLESEIGKVLEHSLAVTNIKVSLDSVTPI